MSLTKGILLGALIALFMTLVAHCGMSAVAADEANEAAWCAAQWHHCSQAEVHYRIHDLEKEVLAERGAAIWYFDGSKYK